MSPRPSSTIALAIPRYECLVLPIERRVGSRIHACFDTFTQEWVSDAAARTVAERTVRDANRSYESGGPPFGFEVLT